MSKYIIALFSSTIISYNLFCSSLELSENSINGKKSLIHLNGNFIDEANNLAETDKILKTGYFSVENKVYEIFIADSLKNELDNKITLDKIYSKIQVLRKSIIPDYISGYEFTLRNGIIKTIPFAGMNAK